MNSFELFGYDIIFDDSLRPWLLEVNSSPSMAREFPIDERIKGKLLYDTIRLGMCAIMIIIVSNTIDFL